MIEKPTIVLVHGAWHGAWIWEKVAPLLAASGWQVRTVELPSTAEEGASSFALHDDAEVVRQQIKQIDGPVVVVAHSYGGAVISEGAADLPNVRHLIYLAAFQLDVGESAVGMLGGAPLPWWSVDDGTITVVTAREVFFHDLQPDDAERAVARLLPFSWAGVEETLTAAAWRSVPSTYVVCEHDCAIPPSAQEQMATRATAIFRLPGSHSPFLSRPSDVAKLIADVATAAARAQTPPAQQAITLRDSG